MLRHLPLLAVDLEPPPDAAEAPADADGVFRALQERGMVLLPRFYEVDLPRGVRVGLTIETDVARLEDDQETTLLRIPRAGIEEEWRERALRLRGTMLCVGHALGIGPDQGPHEVCDLLDLAAARGALLGAIAGVAEPRTGLPLLFG